MRLCVCSLGPLETPVMPGLSVTPVDMETMTAVGRSVSSHALSDLTYNDGYASPSDLPLPLHRGRSQNDNWELMQHIRGKVRKVEQLRALEAADAKLAAERAGKE